MNHVHLIGIGGAGLSAIAQVLLESGYEVSGSDRQLSPLALRLKAGGVKVFAGHHAENVRGADLVVRSSAVPDDNVEVQAAYALNIPVVKRAEFLGKLMAGKLGIAIAGTHGKTTTTAMTAWMLHRLGMDPSYIIGGVAENLGNNAHAGRGLYFVIEADEYDRTFLGLTPTIAVVTNVEHDHPDCYPTAEDFYQAFLDFAGRLTPQGALVACGDDPGAARLLAECAQRGQHTAAYGIQTEARRYQAFDLALNAKGGYSFGFAVLPGVDQPTPNEPETTQVELQTPGEHNVRNAAAALAVAHLLELPLAPAAAALSEFRGTGRRFEVRGEAGGVIAIDDYAHHPTEIRATLAAARERYPARRIWAVWQPHTYSRLQALFNEFASAFSDADQVLVTEIYAAREAPPSLAFSASQVADAIRQHAAKREGKPKSVHFAASLPAAGELLRTQVRPGDVVLVLSAGDADVLSKELLAGLQAAENQSHASNPPALKIRRGVRLDHYTAARIGGPADLLIEVESEAELAQAARYCWSRGLPFFILGGGSNMLVSETGWRGAVILNHAGGVEFNEQADPPTVWAESGANFGLLARLAAQRGLAGLEWAAGIPGTLGGALVGNAGAHGGDLAGNFRVAKILHLDTHTGQPVQVQWNAEQMQFAYRSSRLKSQPGAAVVLSARLHLQRSTPEAVQTRLDEFRAFRRRTQPPGASMGSMFKNPPGDYAGRLIEAAGLKGARRGQAEISPLHANFFINHGGASALEVYSLIELAQETVEKKFGVRLELEIELKGEWRLENSALTNQHS